MPYPTPHLRLPTMRARLGRAFLVVAAAWLAGCGVAAERPLEAAVLVSRETPQLGAALPDGRVATIAIEGFRPSAQRAETVVVAGHSSPPLYLGREAAEVARAIASFEPRLIVLDTCYGASMPLLEALAAVGCRARVVAPAFRLPDTGFVYAPDFFTRPTVGDRAMAVNSRWQAPLLRWDIAPAPLAATRAEVAEMSAATLRKRLRHIDPPLVRVRLGDAGWVLVPVAPERLR